MGKKAPAAPKKRAPKPETVKSFALGRIRDATGWCRDARAILETNDRIDTLDSLRFARKAIEDAEAAIRDTLP